MGISSCFLKSQYDYCYTQQSVRISLCGVDGCSFQNGEKEESITASARYSFLNNTGFDMNQIDPESYRSYHLDIFSMRVSEQSVLYLARGVLTGTSSTSMLT